MTAHDFQESLAKSHTAEDCPVWETIYRLAFHDFATMVSHRQDGWHQRQGIDRSVILTNSKQLLIDEKARWRNKNGKVYSDILLEYWSVKEKQVPGWVCKPLMADYIAYAIMPLGKCYLLPVLQLQEAWRKHGESWVAQYPAIVAKNTGYSTVSVGVPVAILFHGIGAALRVEFAPLEENEASVWGQP